jgi:serine/threonine protein kinase
LFRIGEHDAAERDSLAAAASLTDPPARAEAYHNAYQAALEKRDWAAALRHLKEACKLDSARYAPFPMHRYSPERILGAGGFGVAFLCQDANLKQAVVIKTLLLEDLSRDSDSLLKEARSLNELQHPAVVRLFDCDYADPATRSRPYLVMEHFEGATLEEYVRANGPVKLEDFLSVARQSAEALQAAHAKGVLHRDVKPANILVRQDASGWQVRLIDFGLALKQSAATGRTAASGRSILGATIAGTLEYAAPEQMGRSQVPPGPRSDVYSFSKTCCHALFGTTQPLRKHWAEIPPHLVDLLESGLSENPNERPADFSEVLKALQGSGGEEERDRRAERDRILGHFQKRLSAGISRSPVLKVSITPNSRLLDASQLSALGAELPARLLTTVIGGDGNLPLDLRPPATFRPDEEVSEEAKSRARLHDLFDRKMRRHADIAKRETGVHALWLGYPLLHACSGNGETDRWILAPLFLWPVFIEPDTRLERHLRIGRAPDAPRFNRVMALWVRRELGIALQSPAEEFLADLDWQGWRDCLRNVSGQFTADGLFDFANPLATIPDREALRKPSTERVTGLRLIHAAALGYFRWQNEAILADLEELQARGEIRGVVRGFVSTARLAQPADVEAPPEEDRFLVCEADFSQEQAVWQARSGPGLVVHGPPGTGKSQTIVNVIADTLARGRTVLMVCQKQAATRVVLERLRAVGLSDLCVEVHDPELARKAIFRDIKSQVEGLGGHPAGHAQRERQDLAQEIAALERELDEHARAFHQRHPRYGLSYRDMKRVEQEQHLAFPTVRPLPSLQRVLEGLSWASVEAIARRAADAGRWFAEGDALHNPWRFARLPELQPSVALRADVHNALAQLRARDAQHAEHVRLHGLGLPFPADLSRFAEVGAELLRHLRPLVTARGSLTLRWLPVVRKLAGEGRENLLGYVKQVADLADRVRAAPPYPHWEAIAGETADFLSLAGEVADRIDRILSQRKAAGRGLTECWLLVLKGASEEKLSEYRRRCGEAAMLAGRVAALPPDPVWGPVQRRLPDFEKIAAPVMQRIEDLANGEKANSWGVAAHAWLKVIRGAGLERLPKFEADCRQACELARLARNKTAGPGGGPASQAHPAFAATATQFLARLDQLRGSPPTPKVAIARCWLRALRRADEGELQKRAAECREAVELARQASAHHPDPGWQAACGTWTAPQLEGLRAQAEEFLRLSGAFGRFFSGAFRRAKRQLRRLRPDAPHVSLSALATGLIDYVGARQDRERLNALNRRLVPDYPAPADELSQVSFPRLAEEALEVASWLVRQERSHPLLGAAVDEFLWQDGQTGPDQAALRDHVERCGAWERLEKANQTLVPEFHPHLDARGHLHYPEVALRGLEHAAWLARQEQTNPWLAPLLEAFAREKGAARTAPVTAIRTHLNRVRLGELLASVNRELVPGHQPPADETSAVRYPGEAAAALEAAAAIWLLGTRHTWVAHLLEEALAGNGPAAGTSLVGLKDFIRCRKRRDGLAQATRGLVPGALPPATEAAQLQFPRAAQDSLQQALRLLDLAEAHDWALPLLDAFTAASDPAQAGRVLAELESALARYPLYKALLDTLQHMGAYFQAEGAREPYLAIKAGQTVTDWADRVEKGFDGLQALINLEFDRRERSGPAGEVLKALEDHEQGRAAGQKGPTPEGVFGPDRHGEWWAALVKCSAGAVWQAHCHQESPVLTRLSPDVQQGKARRLKDLLARKRSLEAEVIRERWLVRQQSCRNEPWGRMFQERNTKGGASKSLREAVELSWDRGLPALRPCWLTSPGAASQIFPLSPGLFDLVIFDEASQCPVEQAVPALFRGKNVVVSGDDKQLPPTAFFSAGAEVDEEAEDDDLPADEHPAEPQKRRERRDEERMLMECADLLEAAKGKLKQLYLSVHYRSDHPALIEFSNRAFYRGELESPPPRKVSIEGERPIEYHTVNGVYRDRTNPDEAARVVALLKKTWSAPSGSPSLGVVTFNQAQRDLIEELIEKEASADASFGARYREERDRREGNQDIGFFVKNLENVQGDERDVMIFSTTFGRGAQGRFFRRFGPVGVEGGHRRLNVAVTRAKRQVLIVGSMPIEEIAATGQAKAEWTPASYLRLYLEYARAVSTGNDTEWRKVLDSLGESPSAARRESTLETPLEADVRAALSRMGYRVERGVGESGFQIDLGVLHPDPRKGYVLGIDCDGGAWYNGRSAHIREVWRPGVLERRGWRLHRVWSSQWWMNREAEERRLQSALDSALAKIDRAD